ncbi:MAG: hypothetical protein MUE82_13195 [Chloroflexi bacterium]|jgi:hypothetical protein|nr:hypothetical protein [Chloroflexota bacterium]
MDTIRVAALLGFIALAGLVVYVILRSRTAGRESRDSRAFADGVARVAEQVLGTLGGALALLDDVRRHRMDAAVALPAVEAALASTERFVADVQALPASPQSHAVRADLEADLRRAERALDRTRHGCRILADGRGRGRDLEGQASVKRGYLELQHARDAFAHHVADVARAAPPPPKAR